MKNYLNFLKKNTHSGYTLIELILASVVTVLVISAAGSAVVLMTQKNMIASADGDIKYNLSRAVDFISEEIKTASAVTTSATLSTSVCGSSWASSASDQVILGLTIPPSTTTNVIYYIKQPTGIWLGNKAIYRCGLTFNADGTYGTSYSSDILVDLIASGRDSNNDSGTCVNGGTPLPNDGGSPLKGNTGLFVCISGKMVEIHAAASSQNNTVSNPLGWGSGSGGGYAASAEPIYGIITQAYARAN